MKKKKNMQTISFLKFRLLTLKYLGQSKVQFLPCFDLSTCGSTSIWALRHADVVFIHFIHFLSKLLALFTATAATAAILLPVSLAQDCQTQQNKYNLDHDLNEKWEILNRYSFQSLPSIVKNWNCNFSILTNSHNLCDYWNYYQQHL